MRPVARDTLTGWPIAVARRSPTDEGARCRTPVTHSYAAVAFYTGGRSRVEQQGEWTLAEGDVLLVPAGEPHRMLEVQRPEFWGLAFCVSCLAADGAANLLEPFERVRDGAAAAVHIPAARQGFFEGLFRELEQVTRERQAPSDTFEAVQKSLLTLILNEIGRAASALPSTQGARSGVVAESLRFIERNCLRRLTLTDVAAAVGRSPTYVTSALTQATGRSAGEWIVSGRMAEARRLLLASDERVDVIAERVGYADATHFIRMFRREHGATPAAWRVAQARARPRK
ncbi:MAG TPA: helix-turn-helix domain-containing protein [Labilithrix sp.]|jgi:AraC-like DNA-binding protein|nr:helix-turn-helix domain-containing protein [Labilithrix sp.]